jgi:hypothetical protein
MRWPVLLWLGLLLPAGCRNCDLVEAELRTKDRELRNLKGELQNTQLYNQALQTELQTLRPVAVAPMSPELASQTYTLKELVLGRQTGGYDEGGGPGDGALQVVVEPRDPDGHAIKAPGTLVVEVLQITPEGLKTPLSSWQIPPEQLRRNWRSGLLSTGYQLVLPWKVLPRYSRLRVTARLILTDGRVFEADKDVTIRLPAAPESKPGPLLAPMEPVPVLPEPELPLFVPRKVETHKASDSTQSPDPEQNDKAIPATSWQRSDAAPLPSTVRLLAPTREPFRSGISSESR